MDEARNRALQIIFYANCKIPEAHITDISPGIKKQGKGRNLAATG